MDILQALELLAVFQQLGALWDQILASLPPEVSSMIEGNPLLGWIAMGILVFIVLQLVMSVAGD